MSVLGGKRTLAALASEYVAATLSGPSRLIQQRVRFGLSPDRSMPTLSATGNSDGFAVCFRVESRSNSAMGDSRHDLLRRNTRISPSTHPAGDQTANSPCGAADRITTNSQGGKSAAATIAATSSNIEGCRHSNAWVEVAAVSEQTSRLNQAPQQRRGANSARGSSTAREMALVEPVDLLFVTTPEWQTLMSAMGRKQTLAPLSALGAKLPLANDAFLFNLQARRHWRTASPRIATGHD